MADEAGLYLILWHPEDLNFTKAGELIHKLSEGLFRLKTNPEHFKLLNPKNGWGTYEGLVLFVERYLKACENNPDSEIYVSR